MNIEGTKRLDDPRVQRVVRDLNAYAAAWSTSNPFWAKRLFIGIRWNGKEYVGQLQFRSDQGTSVVHVAFSGLRP